MPKVRKIKEWTESDALAEVIAADACDFVLETSPPDYVEKISQLLGSSSVGQTGRNGAAADPADTDSDSADSLFITQKPVPEAVRSGRRRRHSSRSGPASPMRHLRDESEDDSSPSASSQKSRSKKKKKYVKIRLPKYSFPFLKDRTLKLTSTVLPGPENTRLHCSAMGGFFECMRKLRQSYQTGEDLESHIPTVDMNGECIFPISEGEEDPLEDADMKVVAKKHFVVPSKVKHSQPWYSEKKRDGEGEQQRTSCIHAVGKMSRGWRKTLHKIPTKRPSLRTALSSDLESSDDEDSLYRLQGEGGTSDKQQKGERSVPAQSETPKTNGSLNREKKDNSEEDELCDDSSAPLCEQSPKESIQEGREASITEPHADVLNKEGLSQAGQQHSKSKGQRFLQSGANNITICSETKVKKKNDKENDESAEEDDGQTKEELEVQHAAPSMNEQITEVEETPHLLQTINEPELHDKRVTEESDISDSQRKKKKKKKKQNESPAGDIRQEVHQHFESDVTIGEDSAHLMSSNRSREEKKKKKDKEDDESAKEEMSQSQEEVEVQHAAAYVNEGITEVEETPRLSQIASELELNGKTGMEESDISDSQQKKKKKKKKQNESSAGDVRQEVHQHFEPDVRIGEDSVHLVSFNKDKKKKKKNHKEDNESIEEEKNQSQEEVEVQHAAAYVNEGITEEEEAPRLSQSIEPEFSEKHMMEESDISDSQQKKKKKKKRQNELSAEDVRQEVHQHFEPDVRIREDSAHLMSFNKGKKKKKKKKNNKEDNESLEEEMSHSQEEVEVQHAAAYVNEGITEEEEETPRLSQSIEPEFSEKHMMESGIPNLQQKKKKKKKRKPGGDSAEITGSLEESDERVRKKKKKRKMSAAQESVEKDQELDFEELKGTCEEALSDTGVRKKKKRKRNEAGSESAADAGCSDEAVVVKKKRKKRTEEPRAAGSEETESESLFEHASPSLDTPGNLAGNEVGDNRKKGKSAGNVLLWDKAKCYERLSQTTDKKAEEKKATSRSHFEPPSSHSVRKNKQKNLKRHLHNPSEDFLTER